MADNLHEGKWILVGDWNMVELHDDLAGPSACLHESEERSWKRALDAIDGVDHYLIVATWKGPTFTSQMVSGARFDQSRLD